MLAASFFEKLTGFLEAKAVWGREFKTKPGLKA